MSRLGFSKDAGDSVRAGLQDRWGLLHLAAFSPVSCSMCCTMWWGTDWKGPPDCGAQQPYHINQYRCAAVLLAWDRA